ncbi:hypothetical protein GDO78_020302 [Eleutherodactylus coqui]|uniref:Uncharacterized protein n=1 Tax=Eleutherodactylus coqui TaxID=57060 RepID=A0A8J6JZC1_ELECQ|nr:hypothetical protein GDO78_020302 [Eleutherodactylus coqui]
MYSHVQLYCFAGKMIHILCLYKYIGLKGQLYKIRISIKIIRLEKKTGTPKILRMNTPQYYISFTSTNLCTKEPGLPVSLHYGRRTTCKLEELKVSKLFERNCL